MHFFEMHFKIKFATKLPATHRTRCGAKVHREMLFQCIYMSKTFMAHRTRRFAQVSCKMAHARASVQKPAITDTA